MKIDVISGFLGAGKTTFINKIIPHAQEKLVLIENEYGAAGLDADLLSGLPIFELASGCICCGLASQFQSALAELQRQYQPDCVLVEPSGAGQLSDVTAACLGARLPKGEAVSIRHCVTIVDASNYFQYSSSFGAFYLDQVENADALFFSHLEGRTEEALQELFTDVSVRNPDAVLYEKDWFHADGFELAELLRSLTPHSARCAHDHEHEHDEHEHEHLSGILSSYSIMNPGAVSPENMDELLNALKDGQCGEVFRSKGVLPLTSGGVAHFDFTPQSRSWESIPALKPRAVVIGRNLDEPRIRELFGEAM